MTFRSLVLFFVLGLAAASCQGHGNCSPASCTGCCDVSGQCQPGASLTACGHGGNACGQCGTGLVCSGGMCSATVQVSCTACTTKADCPASSACVQYAGSDYCGQTCTASSQCPTGESCLVTIGIDGTQAQVCVPDSGRCGTGGCPASCPAGTSCNVIDGACEAGGTGGGSGSGGGSGAGMCGQYDLPSQPSCCTSCMAGTANCQANGCYGGWWCDRTACRCHAAVSGTCGGTGGGSGAGGGTGTGGGSGGGGVVSYDGGIGPSGGSVSSLYFAVVGDTRPSMEDDTANYPTAIITKIYQDLAALNPPPQFVVTTGDYMFANPYGNQGEAQLQLYLGARSSFPNIVFSAMGNHECTGASAGNCDGKTTNNLTSYLNHLVTPLGQANPWYTVPINDTNGQWTAKVIVTACNLWNATQKSWLAGELAKPTTFTFVVRHMPTGSNGPCNADMDPMLASANITGLLVGHSHTVYFNSSTKELVEGVGGAPITSSANYGYALVQQTGSGFTVTQHDYQSNAVVGTWSLP